MFVVAVHFHIKPEFVDAFHETILRQASNSVALEPNCISFDVCRDPAEPTHYFLYEVYTDAAAFDFHRTTDHFARFSETVAPMVANKEVMTFQRIPPVV